MNELFGYGKSPRLRAYFQNYGPNPWAQRLFRPQYTLRLKFILKLPIAIDDYGST